MADTTSLLRRIPGRDLGPSTWILAVCQALYFGGVSVDLTLTAVVGLSLAPTPALATAPLAAISVTGALCSFGAGLLAGRFGYPAVMTAGACTAVAGGALSVFAVVHGSFWLLCCGTALVGAYRSTGGYIRYMAAELAPEGKRDMALSFVQYGGLAAAFGGPFLATAGAGFLRTQYAGAYLIVLLLALANVPLLLVLRRRTGAAGDAAGQRPAPVPLSGAARTPQFRLGLIALAGSGAIMTMVMAMAPVAGHAAGHSMAGSALIIQWHLVGMFAPALVSGKVLTRLGAPWTGLIGALLLGLGATCGLLGTGVPAMTAALCLNGTGWNFLYLAGSSLIVACYPPGRGSRVQSVAEGLAAVTGVTASLSAGAVFLRLGWTGSNGPVLAVSVLILLLMLRAGRTLGPKAPAGPGTGAPEPAGRPAAAG